jgi:hypothetical protein
MGLFSPPPPPPPPPEPPSIVQQVVKPAVIAAFEVGSERTVAEQQENGRVSPPDETGSSSQP